MDRAEVEAVEHALCVAGHREARLVVTEIAEKDDTNLLTPARHLITYPSLRHGPKFRSYSLKRVAK